ncbi:hypothetical protein [Streptomyces daliensis]|uniref:Fibronectin type-III domain-containing protein n=1 Tax=Streptomyces daliensis TaxID=299421 RepID=A0A8T4IKC2_9ACTN|nr:hypothetical protein [Streptomyces daliensis]
MNRTTPGGLAGRLGILGAALALTVTTWTGAQVLTGGEDAHALTPPVTITADELPTWQTNGIVWATAEADGVVFAGGTFSTVRPPGSPSGSNERQALNFVALDAATGAPTDCELRFTIGSGTATVRALTVSPDERTLYVGGSFGAVNGVGVSSLAAIDIATCSVKTGFRPAVPAPVHTIDVTDDTVYFGGDFTHIGGVSRGRFAAVSTADATLRAWNPRADEPGRAVEVLPGGERVAIGGDFDTVAGGTSSHALAVVNSGSGGLVKSYSGGFIHRNSVVKDITSDATGFYTANEGTGGGVFDGRIALNLSDLNQRWRDTCLGATQSLVVHKSVLYSGSHAHDCSSTGEFPDGRRRHLLAESVNNTKLLGWLPDTNDGLVEAIGPRALTLSTVGTTDYMWVGGTFTTVNGKAQQGLTRFASSPDTGVPWVPDQVTGSASGGNVTLNWRSSIDLDDSKLTYRVYRNNSATPIGTVEGESMPWRRPTLTFTDTSVTRGQPYTYRITATDGAGNTSGLSSTVTVTP